MAVFRDVMPAFDLLQPTSAADAQRLLSDIGEGAWVMAGGLDSFDWLKDRIKKPDVLVDLSGIDELRGVRVNSDGLEIGAMTTLTDIANHPEVKKSYSLLSDAVSVVASPQIRNQGTLGGNISQDVRCWYYRGELALAIGRGGNICLCRHAGGPQPRDTPSSEPTAAWQGASVGLGAGADRARRQVCGEGHQG